MAAAVPLCVASLAWACAPQAYISVTPSKAAAGEQVTVVGREFAPGGRVEARWNSRTGPVLAIATGSDFSSLIKIPADAAPGYYTLVAVGYATDGQPSVPVRQAPAAIEVESAQVPPGQAENPASAAPAQNPASPAPAQNPASPAPAQNPFSPAQPENPFTAPTASSNPGRTRPSRPRARRRRDRLTTTSGRHRPKSRHHAAGHRSRHPH